MIRNRISNAWRTIGKGLRDKSIVASSIRNEKKKMTLTGLRTDSSNPMKSAPMPDPVKSAKYRVPLNRWNNRNTSDAKSPVKTNGGRPDKARSSGWDKRKQALNGRTIASGNETASSKEIQIRLAFLKSRSDAIKPPMPNPHIATDKERNMK